MKKRMMIGLIKNLNIYFSDACNLNCSYCCLRDKEHNTNLQIRQALEDGSFVEQVKNNITQDTVGIGVWGMEPSINGKYFRKFINEILNYGSYIRYVTIVTNGCSNTFFEDFILPIQEWTQTRQRKLKLQVQFSLDGPPSIMDAHCGQGTYNQVLHTLLTCFQNYRGNQWLKTRFSIKPTFQPQDWHTDPTTWNNWRNNLYEQLAMKDNQLNCGIALASYPTIAHGASYTKADGIAYANWQIPYNASGNKKYTCGAGDISKTIDYTGTLYDCPLLQNRPLDVIPQEPDQFFQDTLENLIANNEVDPNVDPTDLWVNINDHFCFAIDDYQTSLPHYMRLFGNGALLHSNKEEIL